MKPVLVLRLEGRTRPSESFPTTYFKAQSRLNLYTHTIRPALRNRRRNAGIMKRRYLEKMTSLLRSVNMRRSCSNTKETEQKLRRSTPEPRCRPNPPYPTCFSLYSSFVICDRASVIFLRLIRTLTALHVSTI